MLAWNTLQRQAVLGWGESTFPPSPVSPLSNDLFLDTGKMTEKNYALLFMGVLPCRSGYAIMHSCEFVVTLGDAPGFPVRWSCCVLRVFWIRMDEIFGSVLINEAVLEGFWRAITVGAGWLFGNSFLCKLLSYPRMRLVQFDCLRLMSGPLTSLI